MSEAERSSVPREMHYEGIRVLRVPTVGDQQRSLFSRTLFAISFLLSVSWQLCRTFADYSCLVVTTNPPFLGIVGYLFSCLFGQPYLLIVHDIYPDIAVKLGVLSPNGWLRKVWDWTTKLIFRSAAVIVVIGRDMRDVVKAKLPVHLHERIVLIPHWSDERRVQPVPRTANRFRQEHHLADAFVVQYAGRMGRTHNLEPLIEVAGLLADENVIFQLIGRALRRQNWKLWSPTRG